MRGPRLKPWVSWKRGVGSSDKPGLPGAGVDSSRPRRCFVRRPRWQEDQGGTRFSLLAGHRVLHAFRVVLAVVNGKGLPWLSPQAALF